MKPPSVGTFRGSRGRPRPTSESGHICGAGYPHVDGSLGSARSVNENAGLYVGTSGWSYPSWRPGFYPAGTKPEDFLRFYAERFRTVELNTTGYRLPREELFERWAKGTPPGFQFAPKANAH